MELRQETWGAGNCEAEVVGWWGGRRGFPGMPVCTLSFELVCKWTTYSKFNLKTLFFSKFPLQEGHPPLMPAQLRPWASASAVLAAWNAVLREQRLQNTAAVPSSSRPSPTTPLERTTCPATCWPLLALSPIAGTAVSQDRRRGPRGSQTEPARLRLTSFPIPAQLCFAPQMATHVKSEEGKIKDPIYKREN